MIQTVAFFPKLASYASIPRVGFSHKCPLISTTCPQSFKKKAGIKNATSLKPK